MQYWIRVLLKIIIQVVPGYFLSFYKIRTKIFLICRVYPALHIIYKSQVCFFKFLNFNNTVHFIFFGIRPYKWTMLDLKNEGKTKTSG